MKTAVELLEKKLVQIRLHVDKNVLKFIDTSIKEAKEMEKQQIIEFGDWCLKFVTYCETANLIRYYNYLHGNELYTNLELLEIFKKEKGW